MNDCKTLRHKLVKSGVMDAQGKYTPRAETWQIEPCGTPLFSDIERRDGVCRSCASGWTHPENYACDADGKAVTP